MTVRSPSSCWLVNIYARPGYPESFRKDPHTQTGPQIVPKTMCHSVYIYIHICTYIYIYIDLDIDMCIFSQSTSYISTYPHTPVGSPTMSENHRPCVQSHSPYIGPMCGR